MFPPYLEVNGVQKTDDSFLTYYSCGIHNAFYDYARLLVYHFKIL